MKKVLERHSEMSKAIEGFRDWQPDGNTGKRSERLLALGYAELFAQVSVSLPMEHFGLLDPEQLAELDAAKIELGEMGDTLNRLGLGEKVALIQTSVTDKIGGYMKWLMYVPGFVNNPNPYYYL